MAFSAKSTAEEVTEGLDLNGRTFVVTGVNSGLGYETMRVLTMRGAHVIGAARNMAKARESCALINGNATPIACELSEMDSVAACAYKIKAMGIGVDVLICNAGIMALPELQVKNGLEMQFLTNHLGHFLLTYLLQDALKASPEGRIVMLSSAAHRMAPRGGIAFDNLDGRDSYSPWAAYGQSKLANLLTARSFNERLAGSSVTANAVHPGVITTNLGRNMSGWFGRVLSNPMVNSVRQSFMKTVPQGAATQCYVAAHPDLKGVGGKYYVDCKPAAVSIQAKDDKLAKRLWDYSLEYLRDYLD